jgi:hypothetical protein
MKRSLSENMDENSYNDDARRFVKDMEKAGLTPYHYNGRFFYSGPAVNVDSLQDALSHTKVKCQWDDMGKGFVVYPVTR